MPALQQVLAVVVTVMIALAVALGLAIIVYATRSVRYISNHRVGVLEKLWSRRGSVASGLIALHGEAGYQPDVLRGGLHGFRPFQYRTPIDGYYQCGSGTHPGGCVMGAPGKLAASQILKDRAKVGSARRAAAAV